MLWIELAINVLSTLLLAVSNTCAQLLVSPQRADIDAAHSKGKWLDVATPSIRNISRVARWRRICWVLLFASSVPLHLL